VRVEPDGDNNLAKPSAADAFQIRSISQTRFASRVGQISPADLEAIIRAVQVVVGAS
jgi:mRNA interferase MazF